MSGIFSGGGAGGAAAGNMTAMCGKSNGDRICFDMWINRPKFVNRIRADMDPGGRRRRGGASGPAETGGGAARHSIVK